VALEEKPVVVESKPKKLGSLDAIRKKVETEMGIKPQADLPLSEESLKTAWNSFINILKQEKNPAWQSFELASLRVVDPTSFEATVGNNISQEFLKLERNKACAFLQKELQNRQLQFLIVLNEEEREIDTSGFPLSSKEQYQRLVEKYPLVKELKDRLRLDLDF
jgi:DNA polymerase-3 subunit gamma/tau